MERNLSVYEPNIEKIMKFYRRRIFSFIQSYNQNTDPVLFINNELTKIVKEDLKKKVKLAINEIKSKIKEETKICNDSNLNINSNNKIIQNKNNSEYKINQQKRNTIIGPRVSLKNELLDKAVKEESKSYFKQAIKTSITFTDKISPRVDLMSSAKNKKPLLNENKMTKIDNKPIIKLKDITIKCEKDMKLIKPAEHTNNKSKTEISKKISSKGSGLNRNVIQVIDPNQKWYFVSGGYPDVVLALESKGYKETLNPENSDFIWSLKTGGINYKKLKKNQIVNHFSNNKEFTSKLGLCKNIRTVILSKNGFAVLCGGTVRVPLALCGSNKKC